MTRSTSLHRQLKKLLSLLERHSSVRLFVSCCNVVFVLLFVSHWCLTAPDPFAGWCRLWPCGHRPHQGPGPAGQAVACGHTPPGLARQACEFSVVDSRFNDSVVVFVELDVNVNFS